MQQSTGVEVKPWNKIAIERNANLKQLERTEVLVEFKHTGGARGITDHNMD